MLRTAPQHRARRHATSSLCCGVACRYASLARFFRFRGLRSGSSRVQVEHALPPVLRCARYHVLAPAGRSTLCRMIAPSTRCLMMSATRWWRPAFMFDLASAPLPPNNQGRAAAGCPAASFVGLLPSSTGRHMAEVAVPSSPSAPSSLLSPVLEAVQRQGIIKPFDYGSKGF